MWIVHVLFTHSRLLIGMNVSVHVSGACNSVPVFNFQNQEIVLSPSAHHQDLSGFFWNIVIEVHNNWR